jgi:hypothetical protein
MPTLTDHRTQSYITRVSDAANVVFQYNRDADKLRVWEW